MLSGPRFRRRGRAVQLCCRVRSRVRDISGAVAAILAAAARAELGTNQCAGAEIAMISMLGMDRRKFMRGSAAASLSLVAPADLLAQPVGSPPASNWDAGSVRLLLPAVSDTRMLIKVSFQGPLSDAPVLHVGGTSVRGRMGDTRGEHWHFYVTDLQPGRPYPLSLIG